MTKNPSEDLQTNIDVKSQQTEDKIIQEVAELQAILTERKRLRLEDKDMALEEAKCQMNLKILRKQNGDLVKYEGLYISRDLESNSPIHSVNFSKRTFNCLDRVQIKTIDELLQYSYEDLIEIKNMGDYSVEEVVLFLTAFIAMKNEKNLQS